MIRRTTHFSGRVQGVGFRQTTVEIARGFEVTGTVRNLSDGRVELVAEGDAGELTRFEQAITTSMRSNIREVRSADSPANGQFIGFHIAW